MTKSSVDSIPVSRPMPYDYQRKEWRDQGYGEYITYGSATEWVDNVPFEDTLIFMRFGRGRSAAHAMFRSDERKMFYTVFLTDLGSMIKQGVFARGGVVKGTFIGCKRGSNYGVKLHEGS
jgi:hypothetical protein